MFRDIKQLPPAHSLTLTEGSITMARWWEVRYQYSTAVNRADRVADLDSLIDDAVRVHCRSDATVGCHLSGGLDSSLVASLAARHRGEMHAFSVRFPDGAFFDESPFAAEVAGSIGAMHHVVTPHADDLAGLIGALTYHQDAPIWDTAGFSYFAVSRLAASHVKVSMTGHGGDEVFGGYPAQFRSAFGRTDMFDLSKRPLSVPQSRVSMLLTVLRQEGIAGVGRRLYGRLFALDGPDGEWVRLHCGPLPDANPLLHPGFVRSVQGYSPVDEYLRPFREAPTPEPFDRCLYHDLVQYLPTLLMKEDRASMAVSIESRVPLLDYRIVEHMATVPPEEKVPGYVPKALLRAVADRHVPSKIVQRNDKTPFPVPLRQWFSGELRPFAERLLRSKASLDRGIFKPSILRSDDLDVGDLLAMVNVEMWCRVFLDRDPTFHPTGPSAVRGGFSGLPPLRA
jgi:asparagine synthase (glutamine-hydrolysing)